jgi:hypothetical protein
MGAYVVINDVSLDTPAWICLNPMELRQGPPTRGTDRLIPGATGVLPGLRRAAPARRLLDIIIMGDVDEDGDPHDNPEVGLDVNLMTLRDSVTDPQGDPVEAELHLPDGSTAVAQVHVESFEWVYWGNDAKGVIDLTILSGSFVGGGS